MPCLSRKPTFFTVSKRAAVPTEFNTESHISFSKISFNNIVSCTALSVLCRFLRYEIQYVKVLKYRCGVAKNSFRPNVTVCKFGHVYCKINRNQDRADVHKQRISMYKEQNRTEHKRRLSSLNNTLRISRRLRSVGKQWRDENCIRTRKFNVKRIAFKKIHHFNRSKREFKYRCLS